MLAKKTTTHMITTLAHKGSMGRLNWDSLPESVGSDGPEGGKGVWSFIICKGSPGFPRGQVVLEYLLLLLLALSISIILMRGLVGPPGESGGFRSAWASLISAIGRDVPDR